MSEAVKALLTQLETELKQQQLWSDIHPDKVALASTLPFCCDTLLLEQWLQFIFIPRLWALLDAGHSLPSKVSVLPYAEQAFKSQNMQRLALLQLIGEMDKTLSGEP